MNNIPVVPKLGIGPLSSEIIEAAFIYSEENRIPLMLIASKNQIDHSGGYVSGWNTKQYANFVNSLKQKYAKSDIWMCRDHCGPGFNGVDGLDDTYKTIETDLKNGFSLIHIDLCHLKGSHKDKLNESKKIIEHIQKSSPQCLIEIGTDENTGRNFRDLKLIEKDLQFFTSFCKPLFFVSQTGSLIMETTQIGKFNLSYVKKLSRLCKKYGVNLKEHNADYIDSDEIEKRRELVDAVNVAPQFGVIQTNLTLLKCNTYGIDPNPFLERSYRSGKWKKWITKKNIPNKLLCSIVAGHYNFTSPEYRQIYRKISKNEDLRTSIISEMIRNFDLYIKNL